MLPLLSLKRTFHIELIVLSGPTALPTIDGRLCEGSWASTFLDGHYCRYGIYVKIILLVTTTVKENLCHFKNVKVVIG